MSVSYARYLYIDSIIYFWLHSNSIVSQKQYYLSLTWGVMFWHSTRDEFSCAITLYELGGGSGSLNNVGLYGKLLSCGTDTFQTPWWAELKGKGVRDCSKTLSWDNAVTGRLLHSGVSSTLFGSLNYVLAPVLVEGFSCSCELASSTVSL